MIHHSLSPIAYRLYSAGPDLEVNGGLPPGQRATGTSAGTFSFRKQRIEAVPVFKVPQPKPRHRLWFLKAQTKNSK